MSQTATIPPFVNKAMKFVLRSPMHGIVSKSVVLISFTGRKSGKTFTTPVSYSQAGDQVTIFTHATWWKNLRNGSPAGAPVTLQLRGHAVQGLAEPVVEDKQAIADALIAHLRQVPSDTRWYGITFDENGNPGAGQVEKAVESVVMIRVQLC